MLKIATKFAPEVPAFETAWKAGFRFAEFWLSTDLLKRVDTIVEQAKRYPLAYVPHLPNKKVDKNAVERVIRLYRGLNCQAMVLHQPMMDAWGAAFAEQAPEMKLAVENHVLDEEQFWDWAEKNPGLNLDVEHLWLFTLKGATLNQVSETLARFLKKYKQKLNHVHLPGYIPGGDEHRPMYCSRDFVFMVWDQLHAAGYEQFVVSEVNGSYQTLQDLKMDLLLFERWRELRKHNLR